MFWGRLTHYPVTFLFKLVDIDEPLHIYLNKES